jgi:HPr serine kinase-like protein
MQCTMDESRVTTDPLTNDPVLYDLELPLRAVYYPVGFSVEIATNSEQVLAAAEESWGCFPRVLDEPPVLLRIAVMEGGKSECPPPPTVRGQRNLMLRVADATNFSVSHLELGFALGWLTPAVVANRSYLRYYFLEGMAWDLLEPLYLTSVHAACVRLENKGVLLCGDSGAGKSSLAFACARKGWLFLSDDSSCLIRKSNQPVVVGNPTQIRFRDSALELFPELSNRQITRRLNGKLSIEVPTASLPGIRTIFESSVDYIVFLRRGASGSPRLTPFPKEAALQWLEQVICYGNEAVRESQRESLLRLATAEIFELHYQNLDSAEATLREMLR